MVFGPVIMLYLPIPLTTKGKVNRREDITKTYAVPKKWQSKQTKQVTPPTPSTNKGKQAFLDYSYFIIAQQTTESDLWGTPGFSREEWGGKTLFLNSGVSSSEQRWIQSSHSHDGGMKKRVEMENKKGCQELLMCNLSCLSPFEFFFLCNPAFHISICHYFCIFLGSSVFLVSLLLSLSVCLFLVVRSLGSPGQTKPSPDVITASQTEGEETGGRNVGS